MPYMADEYLACSSLAASWMFSEKIIQSKHYHLVNNAIDVDKFKYNRDVSKVMREKLKIKKMISLLVMLVDLHTRKIMIF